VSTPAVIGTLAAEGWELRETAGGELLVGPGGAYLLATKVVAGRATIEAGALTVRVDDVDETVVRYGGLRGRLLAGAARLSRGTMVRPVVVIWGDFPQRAVDDDGVAYVHGEELAAWLRSRPASSHELDRLSA
jgi:hypothetical protein